MTELNLSKANANRDKRKEAMAEYNKLSKAINEFSEEGFTYFVRCGCGARFCQDIFPDAKEFRNLLLNMRDRYDLEISTLDKEFAEL